MNITSILQIIIFITAPLTIILILLQQRGASLGSGSASSSELVTTRRGLEKSIFNTTLITAFLFVISILGLLIF